MSPQPKVIFPQYKSTALAPDAKPASDAIAQPNVLFGQAHVLSPKSSTPKIINQGVLRQRMPCTLEALKTIQPSADEAVLTAALHIVNSVNLNDAYIEDVVLFGEHLQIAHNEITEQTLAIANDRNQGETQDLLLQALRTIQHLNPDEAFTRPSTSLLSALKQRISPKPAPQVLFDAHYPQLLTLTEQLKNKGYLLTQKMSALNALKLRYSPLSKSIDAHVIAAQYMINQLRNAQSHTPINPLVQMDVLTQRLNSLLTTQTTLALGIHTHDVLASHMQALNATLHNVLHEDLPAFHTAYVAALSSANTTTLLPLQHSYQKLFNTLNGECT